MKNKKINVQLLIGIILIIIYIVLISVQPINVRKLTKYDDLLMAQQAKSILEGNYLGEYGVTTLIKGIFTPLVISFLCSIKIPFIVGQNILYVCSVFFFISVIKKKINNKNVLLILFAILLFNPIMFSTELCRVYRDGLYVSLILFLVSSILGIFLNRNEELKKIIWYYIGLGLSFSMVYICREETIWIMPFVIIATVITIIFMLFDSKCINKIKKILFNTDNYIFSSSTSNMCIKL